MEEKTPTGVGGFAWRRGGERNCGEASGAPETPSAPTGERGQGNIEGGGDGAQEFVFFDGDFAVGGDDRGGGGEDPLLDRGARGGEQVQGGVERGEIGGGSGFAQAAGYERKLCGAGGEGRDRIAGGRVGEDREHDGDFVGHGLEGMDLRDGCGRGAAGGEIAEQNFLQAKLERGDAAVGMDEFVEGLVERRESGGPESAEGRQGELQERQLVLGTEGAEVVVEFPKDAESVAAGVGGDEGELAALGSLIVRVEEEAKEKKRSLVRRAGGGEEAGGDGGEEIAGGAEVEGGTKQRGRGGGKGGGRIRFSIFDFGFLILGGSGNETGGDEGLAGDVDHLGCVDEGAVEDGFDGADALGEGWVGGPDAAEHGAETLGEKEMADGGAFRGLERGAEGESADFLERAAEAGGVAGELDGGGVGEEFALTGDCGLDEAAEEIADVADDEEAEADGADGDENAAGVFAVAGGAEARAAERPEDAAPGDTEDENAEDKRGEAHVEAHVAVEDVAELVADDALEFVAREPLERAAGDGDDGIGGGEAGGEGVDGGLVVHNVDGRHGDAGGHGHLLDDVEEAALVERGRVGGDAAAAHALGDGAAAGGELVPFIKRGEADDGEGAEGDEGEELGLPENDRAVAGASVGNVGVAVAVAGAGGFLGELGGGPDGAEVAGGDSAEDGEREERDEPRRALLGAGLGFEEIHQGLGTSRSLQIFRARRSLISVWRGTAERRFLAAWPHHEWLPPSRISSQPWRARCRTSSRRFMVQTVMSSSEKLSSAALRASSRLNARASFRTACRETRRASLVFSWTLTPGTSSIQPIHQPASCLMIAV